MNDGANFGGGEPTPTRSRLLICIVVSLTVSGFANAWAGYKSVKVKVEAANQYPSHQQQGSITIAADAYDSREKLKSAFDLKELDDAGIRPVHVIVTNQGEDPIEITSAEVRLLDSSNRSLEPLAIEEVLRAVLYKDKGDPPQKRAPSRLPIPKGSGRKGDAFEIEADLLNKSLKDSRFGPHTTMAGFVFFKVPENQGRLAGYKLYIPQIRNLRTGQELLFFEIELK